MAVIPAEAPTVMEVIQAEDLTVMGVVTEMAVIQVADQTAAMEVIQVEDQMVAQTVTGAIQAVVPTVTEVIQVEDLMVTVLKMGMGVILVGMGLEDRTRCLGYQLFSRRVLELLAKYCEDFMK